MGEVDQWSDLLLIRSLALSNSGKVSADLN